ncbi:MAG TPA: DUF202 domain-containing protein [Micromonospora sp.]
MNRDPGLPAERTRLAWRRTLLALTIVVVLSARLALSGGVTGALAAAAALAGWVVVLTVAYRRATAPTRAPTADRALPYAALATVGYAALGVVLVLARGTG